MSFAEMQHGHDIRVFFSDDPLVDKLSDGPWSSDALVSQCFDWDRGGRERTAVVATAALSFFCSSKLLLFSFLLSLSPLLLLLLLAAAACIAIPLCLHVSPCIAISLCLHVSLVALCLAVAEAEVL